MAKETFEYNTDRSEIIKIPAVHEDYEEGIDFGSYIYDENGKKMYISETHVYKLNKLKRKIKSLVRDIHADD